ncbi:hypothetical protein DPMN_116268 [Dreissena polymorpha]|uniref:Uncharacterized protein n=1 Tax=Dreissena polymorpha TaxID=45954 RepID=A0A9D4KNN8_DREPO|nr:hypothetical protein DPMN_116268 [Dreissena polymorpha]
MLSRNCATEADAYPHAACLTQGRPRYQLEVNRKKAILGWCGLCGRGAPGLVMGPFIVEIDLNRLKDNFGWVWPMWAGRPRIDRIVIREVQYLFEVNRCRNEEIIVKCNFGWVWSMWAGRPRIVEIDRIVIREVQYQFEVNRCRHEEIIVKDNFGWVWYMWEVCPWVEIDRIVIREVQYQFEVNRCRNEEIIGVPGLVMGPCIVEIDRIVIREVQYQFEVNRCRNKEVNFQGFSANSVGGDSGQDGRTEGRRR